MKGATDEDEHRAVPSTWGEVCDLEPGPRRRALVQLPVFRQAVCALDQLLDGHGGTSHRARWARLGDYLEYSCALFPAEENQPGSAERRVHSQQLDWRPDTPLAELDRWLGEMVNVGARQLSRLQEYLLISLCEQRLQWPLAGGSAHPARPRRCRHDTNLAFVDVWSVYDHALRGYLAKRFPRDIIEPASQATWLAFHATFWRSDAPTRFFSRKSVIGYLLVMAVHKAVDAIKNGKLPERTSSDLDSGNGIGANGTNVASGPESDSAPQSEVPLGEAAWREQLTAKLIASLKQRNRIPPAVCAIVFDPHEHKEMVAQIGGGEGAEPETTEKMRLLAQAYFFCNWSERPLSLVAIQQSKIARLWGLTPARVNQLLRGYTKRSGERIPGAHDQLLPWVRRKLGLE